MICPNPKLVRLLLVSALAGIASSALVLAQGCCGDTGARTGGCTREVTTTGHSDNLVHNCSHSADVKVSRSAAPLPRLVQTVLSNYAELQSALAQDSMEKAKIAAAALLKSVRTDTDDLLPPGASQAARVLAESADLAEARSSFKELSEILIAHLKARKLGFGEYHEAYCSMAKASWLQAERTIVNPYMGKQMLHCGQLKS